MSPSSHKPVLAPDEARREDRQNQIDRPRMKYYRSRHAGRDLFEQLARVLAGQEQQDRK
jgi:hypothetical protein